MPPLAPGEVLGYLHSTYVGSGQFWELKILNFNIFGGFQKNVYFWGYKDFCGYFWRTSQNLTTCLFRGHFYAFKGLFLRPMGIFLGCRNFSYFLRCLKFLISFGGEQ